MNAYIKSTAAITPQHSLSESFSSELLRSNDMRMAAVEPEYKEFIPPIKLRRMNRVVKMGLSTAIATLRRVSVEQPGAIITATGWGCLADTYKFLDEIVEKDEQTLSPATFIQSTHNTVGGQIALMLGCQEYNSVYVNSTSSFEHGMIDAIMLLQEGKNNALIGGIDELDEKDFQLKDKAGYWKNDESELSNLTESKSKGTIAGEGSVFFLLSGKNENNQAVRIDSVKVSANPPGTLLDSICSENNITKDDIQIVISGINGDAELNEKYRSFYNNEIPGTFKCFYKHLCGEYDTSSAYALWLAEKMISTQQVPDYLSWDQSKYDRDQINRILIHHINAPDEHAFILVSKANI